MQEREGVYLIDKLEEVPGEVSRLRGYGVDVCFDVESTGLSPINDRLVTLQFKPKGKRAVIIDVRHFDAGQLMTLGSMLEVLFDGQITIVGHALKFDFGWAFAKAGLAGHKAYCTMLAEQVILGLGTSSANERGIHFGMADLAERYGLVVEKESRSWFIDLDKREEGAGEMVQVAVDYQVIVIKDADGNVVSDGDGVPFIERDDDNEIVYKPVPVMGYAVIKRPWDEPFPAQQIRYMRQDVSIPHRIKDAQQAAIEEYELHEVIDLEMRDIFPTTGKEVWGVQINREGWLDVIDRVSIISADLERTLHLGLEGEYEGLDVHILKVRNDRYMEKWAPYEKWMQERDAYVVACKEDWEARKDEHGFKNWSEYKKYALDMWYVANGKQTKPPINKDGVNLGSWMQVRDGFNDLKMRNPEYDPEYPSTYLDKKWVSEFIEFESVSEETLTPYIGLHPLVQVCIDHAHARKIVTVYGSDRGKKKQSFLERLDSTDRLRPTYQQIGADTGRKSSNLQQMPDTGYGKELRKCVIAAPGYVLVDADLPNIELRVVADLSGDRFLLDAFAAGGDIHSSMAGIMFGLTPEQATKEWADSHNVVLNGREVVGTSYRKLTKTCNFALLYGAGNERLAVTLHQPVEVATRLRGVYRETFATAIAWLDQQKNRLEVARRTNQKRVYAVTLSGRRRWFDIPVYPSHPANGGRVTVEAQEKWDADKEEWKKQMGSIRRQLANHVIQGLAADIMKEAECLWYEKYGYDEECRWVASIHDEGIVEVIQSRAEEASRNLEDVMYRAMSKYLKVVNLGKVEAVITPFWSH